MPLVWNPASNTYENPYTSDPSTGYNAWSTGPAPNAPSAPAPASAGSSGGSSKPPTYNAPQLPFATTTPGYNGNGGAAPQYGTQSPNFLGTGQYVAPLMPINDQAITGNPSQGASSDYGLNDVWGKLNTEIANAPKQGAQMAYASQMSPASYQAATGTAAQAGASGYNAAQSGAAQGQATYGQAAQVAGPAQGGYAVSGPVGISTAGDASWQGQQQGLANTLNLQANGGGVSAADLQLARGGEQNIAGQLAVLGSQRGSTNAALAQRSAADQTMAVQAQTNQQMGIQRAQETAQAQQALGSVLGTARGQAQSYNANDAQLAQQTALQNAANAQQATLANTGYAQQTGVDNAQMAEQQVLANQQAANAMTGMNVGNLQQSNLSNTGAINAAYSQGSQQSQQATQANMAALNSTLWQNLAAMNAANSANAGWAQQGSMANQSASNQIALANQNTQSSNAALQNQIIQAGLGAQTGIADSNRAASLADIETQLKQMLAAGEINEQAYQAAMNANSNLAGGVISGASTLLSQLSSNKSGGSGGSGDGGDVTTYVPSQTDSGFLPGNYSSLSDENEKTQVRWANPMMRHVLRAYHANAFGRAVSDENMKTGIEGGNPMIASYLRSYRDSMQFKAPDIDVTEGTNFRNPTYGTAGGTAGSGGSSTGKAIGTAAGAAAGTFIPIPIVGTAFGGFLGGLFGSAFDSSGTPGTSGGRTMTSQGSGITGLNDDWPAADGYTDAVSDENEKSAVTSGNRGMQAFLEQANVQQGAQANSGSQSDAFSQSSGPPSAQVNTQLPPWLASNANQTQAYMQAQYGSPNPNAGYGQQQPWQSPGFGGQTSGAGASMGGIYGGGVTDQGGYGGGGVWSGQVYGGGLQNAGGYSAGGYTPGGNGLNLSGLNNLKLGGMFASPPSTYAENPGPLASEMSSMSARPNSAPITYTPSGSGAPLNLSGLNNLQLGGMFAPTMSDENEKASIAPARGNVQDMLDQLHAYQYRYKNPNMPGAAPGKHLGVMAQDLEKSPLGSQFVETGPDGAKRVNYGQMAGVQMAASAMLNERLEKAEKAIRQIAKRQPAHANATQKSVSTKVAKISDGRRARG